MKNEKNIQGMKDVNDAVIYIQGDARYNSYLMRKVDEKTVLEHVALRARMIGEFEILSCLYNCAENIRLGETLKSVGVNVEYCDVKHVNRRFIHSVIERKEKYVIRVAADQLCLNSQLTELIVEEMKKENYEFFYPEPECNAIVGDIICIDVLRKYYNNLITADRYFSPLCSNREVRRYLPKLPKLFFPCRANCDEGFLFSKKIVENNLDILEVQNNLIARLSSNKSDLRNTGIWRSWLLGNINDFFYDADGCVNPWWCEGAVNLTKNKIVHTPNIRVFEWGIGNSTLFWAHYAKEVVSVESDLNWYEKMKCLVPAYVRIEYRELIYGGDYSRAILNEEGEFDIIVIDGRDRVRCAKNCVKKLKKNGIIIWDNSDRDYYQEGFQYLKGKGFKQLELSGIIWGLPGVRDYTSIFYRENNMWEL